MKTFHPVARDSRYTIAHLGVHRFRLCFDGALIGEFRFFHSAVMRAVGHHAVANGAAIIVEMRSEDTK